MTTSRIQRPQRWDEPFGEVSERDLARVLSSAPFCEIDPAKFPPGLALLDILRNDANVTRYSDGDIIVRRGDYGNSAYFVLSGTLRVALENLPESLLGRAPPRRRGWLSALAQLWRNPKLGEVRQPRSILNDRRLGSRDKSSTDVQIFLQDVPAILSRFDTAAIAAGDSFGEIAALARTPRTATVFAQGDCELLEIRWQGLRDIRSRSPEIQRLVDRQYRDHSLLTHLRETPIFAHLSDDALADVASRTEFETYGSFNWHTSYKSLEGESAANRLSEEPVIALEGDYPNGIVLIRGGFARVSQRYGSGERTVRYLGRGQMYGFEEICQNWRGGTQIPLQFSLRALGYMDVLVVPTAVLEELVLPGLPAELMPADPPFAHLKENVNSGLKTYTERLLKVAGADRTSSTDTGVMEQLVEGRFINGTTTMMINLDRCTRCDDCVRACATAHDNNPRFIRHGPKIGRFMVANACMHCADPVCMIGCPTGAIHRNQAGGQVVINDATCIGCATCANSCPYENIRMVSVRSRGGDFMVDEMTRQPILKATKCDLCVDQMTGPACQNACPHDALKRVDMHDLDTLTEWMQR